MEGENFLKYRILILCKIVLPIFAYPSSIALATLRKTTHVHNSSGIIMAINKIWNRYGKQTRPPFNQSNRCPDSCNSRDFRNRSDRSEGYFRDWRPNFNGQQRGFGPSQTQSTNELPFKHLHPKQTIFWDALDPSIKRSRKATLDAAVAVDHM